MRILDTLVIGAGPAGLGTALALDVVDDLHYGVVDRGRVGQTFLDWPEPQRFLTPSFPSNGYGATDLNSIHPLTSPAYSLGVDYPTGRQYATYLRSVAKIFEIPVVTEVEVLDVLRSDGDLFTVETTQQTLRARTVVWAGGEFHQKGVPAISGGDLLTHASEKDAWRQREADVVILGGFESGIDLACHHIAQGAKQVTVVDGSQPWDDPEASDPSLELAPRTRMRLSQAQASGRLAFFPSHAVEVAQGGEGFVVELEDGQKVSSTAPPIAATGFGPGLGPVSGLFEQRDDGWPLVDDNDESTIIDGLFLSGAALRHGSKRFCFVYKFRQRYAHIAHAIGHRLGKNTDNLEAWREAGMWAEDIAACGADCTC
ncbi:NAD(P)/FAD-dependent oxidoreductase [Nesterenkonia sphaerica]|uniref:Pyridine nucleotide-disulfide oxidoreductase n=1 Tax=Nesterenkonia sphaerica TaxID=1804988 RepID=A0A5R9AF07_9MICC|nr:NAD(P)/FAD-dependent oxidoreductase [Nesterenkonia sphaerica]TLP77183.1 pyridine nucleotide-disulfide oxidoreductase [Nesterenkonia sphaerica]